MRCAGVKSNNNHSQIDSLSVMQIRLFFQELELTKSLILRYAASSSFSLPAAGTFDRVTIFCFQNRQFRARTLNATQ